MGYAGYLVINILIPLKVFYGEAFYYLIFFWEIIAVLHFEEL